MTWILARSAAEPDRNFFAIGPLAAAIVAWRAALPLDPAGLAPELELAAVTAARCDLPGGAAIAVRARLGPESVARLGYVFAPVAAGERRAAPVKALMAAILAAQPQELTPHAAA